LHGVWVGHTAAESRQVHKAGRHAHDFVAHGLELGQQLAGFERTQGVTAQKGVQ
jgi:hypothetical protein